MTDQQLGTLALMLLLGFIFVLVIFFGGDGD